MAKTHSFAVTGPTWTARIWAEYRAGYLTRAARDVLLTLHTFRGTGGRCWPSHATLADRARCCTRTVQRALQQAQGLGLVDWCERRVRAGWRWLRTSNLYRLGVPSAPVQAGEKLRHRSAVSRAPALPDIAAGEGRVSKKAALGFSSNRRRQHRTKSMPCRPNQPPRYGLPPRKQQVWSRRSRP